MLKHNPNVNTISIGANGEPVKPLDENYEQTDHH